MPGIDNDFFISLAREHGFCSDGGLFTITLGARGSVTVDGERVFRVPALGADAVDIVDTTGAGDVFHASYAYGLLSGWAPERVVRFATAAAGLSCQGLGGRAALPTLDEALGAIDNINDRP